MVPDCTALLMTGKVCQVQMFRVGSNVCATQFHPEGDSEGFILRIHACKHYGYFEPHQADCLIAVVTE